MKKKQIFIILSVVVTLSLCITGYILYKKDQTQVCSQTDMLGNCLPEGMCVAPTDGIVACDDLDQEYERILRNSGNAQ